jgi:hypothetical protein
MLVANLLTWLAGDHLLLLKDFELCVIICVCVHACVSHNRCHGNAVE